MGVGVVSVGGRGWAWVGVGGRDVGVAWGSEWRGGGGWFECVCTSTLVPTTSETAHSGAAVIRYPMNSTAGTSSVAISQNTGSVSQHRNFSAAVHARAGALSTQLHPYLHQAQVKSRESSPSQEP